MSDFNMALEQPYLTEQRVEDRHLVAAYDLSADQHDPEYAHHGKSTSTQQSMQIFEQQVELHSYHHNQADDEGMWAERQSISQTQPQGKYPQNLERG